MVSRNRIEKIYFLQVDKEEPQAFREAFLLSPKKGCIKDLIEPLTGHRSLNYSMGKNRVLVSVICSQRKEEEKMALLFI